MRYESQRIAQVYWLGALLIFAVQVLFGLIGGTIYVLPNLSRRTSCPSTSCA